MKQRSNATASVLNLEDLKKLRVVSECWVDYIFEVICKKNGEAVGDQYRDVAECLRKKLNQNWRKKGKARQNQKKADSSKGNKA